MKILGLEFVPLFVPLKRRLETLAIVYYCFEFLFTGLLATFLLVILVFTPACIIPLSYVIWMYLDRHTPHLGCTRRTSVYLRSLSIWKYCRDYFPVNLIKSPDCALDPEQNFIFLNHPHGIMCFGAFINFATEATGFSKLFPNIKPTLITLEEQFKLPIHRDFVLLLGEFKFNFSLKMAGFSLKMADFSLNKASF